MKLNDKLYTVLKWCSCCLIPAAATFYVALSGVWGWPYADQVAKTATAVCTFLGALLGISAAEYHREINDVNGIDWDDDQYWDDDDQEEGEQDGNK